MAALAKAGSVLPQPVRLRSRMARIDTLNGTSEERRTDNPADEVGRASAGEAELARDNPALRPTKPSGLVPAGYDASVWTS
jgi:hypothetical protein